MSRKKLTALSLAVMSPRHASYPDHLVAGLGLRVGKNRRTWIYRYRAGGKNLAARLGFYPAMSLAEAREAARKLMERVESGAPAPQAAPHPRSALTVGVLIDRFE